MRWHLYLIEYVLFQHNTMESLLERGEKLDDLVQKSEHLGNQSKAFYKTVSTLHAYKTQQQHIHYYDVITVMHLKASLEVVSTTLCLFIAHTYG